MAQRRFGNVLSSRLEGNDRENVVGQGKVVHQPTTASTRSTLGDIGNNPPAKVYTRTQKELNVHPRRPLHKSKTTTTLLPKASGEKDEAKVESVRVRSAEPMDLDNVKEVVDEVSEAFKQCEIIDIDAEDSCNSQFCSEYANEIYRYLLEYEKEFVVNDYMKEQKRLNERTRLNERMRSILVDWLVQVHDKFKLLQETLHLTVSYVDRYLSKEIVPRNELQLVGVTAMLLASKYEEMYAPEIGDFVYITDQAYDKALIRQTEAKMFTTLEHKLGDPLCLHFLRRNSKAAQAEPETHNMAKYFMELMLVDYESTKFLPSEKAAAALCLALKLLDDSEWTPTLEHYSSYSESSLKQCMKRISQLILRTKNKTSEITAVTNKYGKHKFMKVSLSPCLDPDTLFKIAEDL